MIVIEHLAGPSSNLDSKIEIQSRASMSSAIHKKGLLKLESKCVSRNRMGRSYHFGILGRNIMWTRFSILDTQELARFKIRGQS
jgi:hypothetical protein